MIVISVMGGLGNQMFQYTLGKYIELEFEVRTTFSFDMFAQYTTRLPEIETLGLSPERTSRDELRCILGPFAMSTTVRRALASDRIGRLRPRSFVTDTDGLTHKVRARIRAGGNLYLQGYWQRAEFFEAIYDKVWGKFKFPKPVTTEAREWAARISDTESVGIHVRRGDYLNSPSAINRLGTLSEDYYRHAAAKLAKRLNQPEFFIFSDDPNYVSERFPDLIDGPVHIVHTNEPTTWSDMHLMSLCRHNVIANSTYSWWSAALNRFDRKIVVAPTPWFADGHNYEGLIPTNWEEVAR